MGGGGRRAIGLQQSSCGLGGISMFGQLLLLKGPALRFPGWSVAHVRRLVVRGIGQADRVDIAVQAVMQIVRPPFRQSSASDINGN